MSYEYYDEYGPSDEEIEEAEEEREIEESTEAKLDDKLQITFDMENFGEKIVQAVVNKLYANLYNEVIASIKHDVINDIKRTIITSSGEIMRDIINDFMENEVIKIGGDYWNETPAEELTLKQYAKRCVRDAIQDQKFRIVTDIRRNDRRYGDPYEVTTKEFGFDEWIKANLGVGNEMQEFMTRQVGDIKDKVNQDMKNMFDKSTKDMLSDAVFNVLVANDTYNKIRGHVAQIADRVVG